MKQLIELLQNEKLSDRTKRFLCAVYALPVHEGSIEFDVRIFSDLLGEAKSSIIACCQELSDNGISYIDDCNGECYYYYIEREDNIMNEIVIHLTD